MDEKILEGMRECVKVQGYDGNWNYDPYMQGMYNGMELMLAIVEGHQPEYKEASEEWRKDMHKVEKPVAQESAS